jgi:hypothetical protein
MKKYTVILLYPDYLRAQHCETYMAHISCVGDAQEAIQVAQRRARHVNSAERAEDFAPVACFKGHLEDLA